MTHPTSTIEWTNEDWQRWSDAEGLVRLDELPDVPPGEPATMNNFTNEMTERINAQRNAQNNRTNAQNRVVNNRVNEQNNRVNEQNNRVNEQNNRVNEQNNRVNERPLRCLQCLRTTPIDGCNVASANHSPDDAYHPQCRVCIGCGFRGAFEGRFVSPITNRHPQCRHHTF